MNIIKVKTLESTNSYLKALAEKQMLKEGTVVTAINQTAGKGQRGNAWESEDGKNITCSFLFYPTFLPMQQHFLFSEAISLAVKETLDAYVEGITIKWPNDIYYKEQKIAGILIENELMGSTYVLSVAGIGINVNQEKFLSDAPNPVSLRQITGRKWDTEILLTKLVQTVLFWYDRLRNEETGMIIRAYHEALYRKTGFHYYGDENGIFRARIDRVADDGFLHLITDEGEKCNYAFKTVSFK